MRRLMILLCFSMPAFLLAQESTAPAFVAHTVDGSLPPAPLKAMAVDWSLQLGAKTLQGADWIRLRRFDVPLPPYPVQRVLVLSNGDRVPLAEAPALRLEEESLFFQADPVLRSATGTELSVPQFVVAGIWLAPPKGED